MSSMRSSVMLRSSKHEPKRALGFGSTSSATHDDVLALVLATLAECGPVQTLATLDRREALGRALARTLGLELRLFPAFALARVPGMQTSSALAAAVVGTASVAEAAALAAAGPGARLIVPRRSTRTCTCAVAERA
jgi:Cobalamin synthesis G C-terminus